MIIMTHSNITLTATFAESVQSLIDFSRINRLSTMKIPAKSGPQLLQLSGPPRAFLERAKAVHGSILLAESSVVAAVRRLVAVWR